MSHKGGGEVLRGACALALGDEPLAGGVEYRSLELWHLPPEVSITLHHENISSGILINLRYALINLAASAPFMMR